MELTEYLAVVRRHWRIWVAITAAALLLAAIVLQLTPRTYAATARVFVAASPSISNSAQFVNQRTKSYPGVAVSQAVLGPVIERLGLDETTAELRSRITADNPVDTSQVQVTASGRDPQEAASIANAVAEQLAEVVEELETPQSGNRPVTLTVSDPATVPTAPVSPVPAFVLGLGLFAGLFAGLAAAVVRSRLDSRLHSEHDIRRLWGDGAELQLLAPRRGRAARSALTGRPATSLARRLELAAEDRSLRLVALSPAPDELRSARAFADEVAAELRSRGVAATVTGPGLAGGPVLDERRHVRIEVADPLAPLRFWRDIATRYDGVVLVVPRGRVDQAELCEIRDVLTDAGITPLAVVLTDRHRPAAEAPAAPAPAAAADRPPLPPALNHASDEPHRLLAPKAEATAGARTDVPDSKHKGATAQRRLN